MIKSSQRSIAFAAIMLSAIFSFKTSSAQPGKPGIGTLQVPPANIAIDGNAKEWGDKLPYFNGDKKISYGIANDKDNLYMVAIISNPSQQKRIIKAGFTFSVDTRGKKRTSYSITFPTNLNANNDGTLADDNNNFVQITERDRDEFKRLRATTLRGIKLEGFKDIDSDVLTNLNTFGILASISFDEKGNLVCEAAIPLKYFRADDLYKNEWAFNLRINGLTSPASAGNLSTDFSSPGAGAGRGGRGALTRIRSADTNGDPGSRGILYQSEDFWEKFYLAK